MLSDSRTPFISPTDYNEPIREKNPDLLTDWICHLCVMGFCDVTYFSIIHDLKKCNTVSCLSLKTPDPTEPLNVVLNAAQ